MKHFFIVLSVFVFFANIVITPAMAGGCFKAHENTLSDADVMQEMPCHEQGEKQTLLKHCDGVCFCIHASVHQMPILTENIALIAPLFVVHKRTFENASLTQWQSLPLFRPPKYIS